MQSAASVNAKAVATSNTAVNANAAQPQSLNSNQATIQTAAQPAIQTASQTAAKMLTPPQGWEQIHGDIKQLREDENYKELIIFKNNNKNTIDALKAMSENLRMDSMNKIMNKFSGITESDNKKFVESSFLNHIFIQRVTDKYHPKGSYGCSMVAIPTGRKPISLVLCFDTPFSSSKFTVLKNKIYNEDQYEYIKCYQRGDNPEFLSFEKGELYKKEPKTIHVPDLFYKNSFITFNVGEMSQHYSQTLFDLFVEHDIFSREEADYFMNMCGHKKPCAEEVKMLSEIQKAINSKNYDEAIKMAKQVHAFAIDENRKQHRILSTDENENGEKIDFYLDDATAAYELGEGLATVSPMHAFQAYEVITDSSPLYADAKEKMMDLALKLTESCKSEKDVRYYREKAMKSLLQSLGSTDDKEKEAYLISLFFKLIETHAGYNPMDPTNRLFNNTPQNSFKQLATMLFTMSNVIYEKNEQIKKLSGTSNTNSTSKVSDKATTVALPNAAVVKPDTSSTVKKGTLTFSYSQQASAAASSNNGDANVKNLIGSGSLDDDEAPSASLTAANMPVNK